VRVLRSLIALFAVASGSNFTRAEHPLDDYWVATEPKHFALLIGADTYDHMPPLVSVNKDISLLSAALTKLQFEVTVPTGKLNRDDMLDAVTAFEKTVKDKAPDGNAIALVFFAGHGFSYGNDGYWAPRDLNPALFKGGTGAELPLRYAVQLDWVIRTMSDSNAMGVVIVVDACRERPTRLREKSLDDARSPPTGAMVARGSGSEPTTTFDTSIGITIPPHWDRRAIVLFFSTQAGRPAYSPADSDANTIFVTELVDALSKHPSYHVDPLFSGVRTKVEMRTANSLYPQNPDLSVQGGGSFPLVEEQAGVDQELPVLKLALSNPDVCAGADYRVYFPVTHYLKGIKAWESDHAAAIEKADCWHQQEGHRASVIALRADPVEHGDLVVFQTRISPKISIFRDATMSPKAVAPKETRVDLDRSALLISRPEHSLSTEVLNQSDRAFVPSNRVYIPPSTTGSYWRDHLVEFDEIKARVDPTPFQDETILAQGACDDPDHACAEVSAFVTAAAKLDAKVEILAVMDDIETIAGLSPAQAAFAKAMRVQRAAQIASGGAVATRIYVHPKSMHPKAAGRILIHLTR